ncbi:MAG: tetratricopeptide repeat protein [Gemmataceae bacterium]
MGQTSFVSTSVVRIATLLVAVFSLTGSLPSAQARFLRPDLMQIPVQRLVKNLEEEIKTNPKNVALRFNLARALAMTYAVKSDTIKVQRNKLERGAWFGYTPGALPFAKKVKKGTPGEQEIAQEYLKKAMAEYDNVIKLKKDYLPAMLGRAWLVEQSGKKDQAIKEYRAVLEKAWKKEGKLRAGRLGGNYITVEAATYLIPLLDNENDAEEIRTLGARVAKLKRLPRPITPIAIPLQNEVDLRAMLDRKASVVFDADGSGLKKKWTWIRPNAGWLVYDQLGDKKITSGLQLFGNVTFWMFWENGYRALESLDDNRDGFLTGTELKGLAIWRDRNGNGISEVGEVRSLAAWGINKLSCRFERRTKSNDCAALSTDGVFFRDGTVRPTYDLILHQQDQ